MTPPRTPELLLEALGAAPAFRDALLGDLAEEHARRAEAHGPRDADRWYRREALRTAPHLLWDGARRLRAGDLAHLAGLLASAYVLTSVLVLLALTFVAAGLRTFGVALPPRALAPNGPTLPALMLPAQLALAVLGGWMAATLGRRAPLATAVAMGVAWAACGVVALLVVDGALRPVTQLAFPLLILVGAPLGGALRVRREGAQPAQRIAR